VCVHIVKGSLLRDTVKRPKVFDPARWKYTRHFMTEKVIHINGKRVAKREWSMSWITMIHLTYNYDLTMCFVSSTIIYVFSNYYRLPSNYHLCIIYLSFVCLSGKKHLCESYIDLFLVFNTGKNIYLAIYRLYLNSCWISFCCFVALYFGANSSKK